MERLSTHYYLNEASKMFSDMEVFRPVPRVQPPQKRKIFKVNREGPSIKDKPTRDSNNYGGCFYNLRFQVDREIYLNALEFFGPANVAKGTYKVFYYISQQLVSQGCFYASYSTEYLLPHSFEEIRKVPEVVDAENGKRFSIQLRELVKIPVNEWVDVKFELLGPDTHAMKRETMQRLQKVKLPDGSDVTFTFGNGSRQLPGLLFEVEGVYETN